MVETHYGDARGPQEWGIGRYGLSGRKGHSINPLPPPQSGGGI